MKFNYNIGPRDLVYLNYNIVGEKHLKRLRANLIMTPALIIIVLILFSFREGSRPSPIFIVISLILLGIWIKYSRTVLDNISIRRISKAFKNEENKWLLNERTMEVNDDRIVETIDHLNGLEKKVLLDVTYDEIYTVDRSKEGIYIFVNDRSAFILPARAFKGQGEMDSTYAYIEERFDEAQRIKKENEALDEEEILVAEENLQDQVLEKDDEI